MKKSKRIVKFAQTLMLLVVMVGVVCGSSLTVSATELSETAVPEYTEVEVSEENVEEVIVSTEAKSGSENCYEWSFANGILTIIPTKSGTIGQNGNGPWDDFKSSVTRIVIEDNDNKMSIGNSAFDNMYYLTSIKMGKSITYIGDSAFQGCSALTNVLLPDSVMSIGSYAFSGCKSIEEIEIPDSVSYIGSYAFYKCSSLHTVVLGDSIKSIEKYAFWMCNINKITSYSNDTQLASDWTERGSSSAPIYIYGFLGSTIHEWSKIPTYYNYNYFTYFKSLDAPEHQKIVNVVSGVHIYWHRVRGALKYDVYRATSKSGTYTLIKEGCTSSHYIDTTAVSGKTYYYKVRAISGPTVSELSQPSQGIKYVGTPDITSRINKGAGIQLGWNKISGATGYAIYRKPYNGSTWTRVATIKGNSTFTWTDESVKANNGTIYKYTIRALAGSDMKTLSGCRTTGRTMVRLASRTLSSATKASATSIKCSWTTSSAVNGYEVRFMVGDTVYKTVTVGNYKTGVKTFTGLKAGQTYKVQVRSYKKVTGVGSFYSAWSTAKYVKL